MLVEFEHQPARAQSRSLGDSFHFWYSPNGAVWAGFYRVARDYIVRFPDLADFHLGASGLVVQDLTQGGTRNNNEGGGPGPASDTTKKSGSSRHMKEHIAKIGTHPLGFGLYLFDYKSEFLGYAGHGRQFGVMIDEVVGVVPAAIGIDESGYPVVDYSMLGIHRPMLH